MYLFFPLKPLANICRWKRKTIEFSSSQHVNINFNNANRSIKMEAVNKFHKYVFYYNVHYLTLS